MVVQQKTRNTQFQPVQGIVSQQHASAACHEGSFSGGVLMVDVSSLFDEEIDQIPDLREAGHINESQLAAQVQQGRVSRGFRQGGGRGHGRIHVRSVFQQNMCNLQCGVRSVQVQGKKGRGHFPAEIGIVPGFAKLADQQGVSGGRGPCEQTCFFTFQFRLEGNIRTAFQKKQGRFLIGCSSSTVSTAASPAAPVYSHPHRTESGD